MNLDVIMTNSPSNVNSLHIDTIMTGPSSDLAQFSKQRATFSHSFYPLSTAPPNLQACNRQASANNSPTLHILGPIGSRRESPEQHASNPHYRFNNHHLNDLNCPTSPVISTIRAWVDPPDQPVSQPSQEFSPPSIAMMTSPARLHDLKSPPLGNIRRNHVYHRHAHVSSPISPPGVTLGSNVSNHIYHFHPYTIPNYHQNTRSNSLLLARNLPSTTNSNSLNFPTLRNGSQVALYNHVVPQSPRSPTSHKSVIALYGTSPVSPISAILTGPTCSSPIANVPISPPSPVVARAGSAATLHDVIPHGTIVGGAPCGWSALVSPNEHDDLDERWSISSGSSSAFLRHSAGRLSFPNPTTTASLNSNNRSSIFDSISNHSASKWPAYVVVDRLGAGSFGCVYRGRRLGDGHPVAIKIEPILDAITPAALPSSTATKNIPPTNIAAPPRMPAGGLLPAETKVLLALAGATGFPCVHWYGIFALSGGRQFRALIMDTLGPSLQDLLERRPLAPPPNAASSSSLASDHILSQEAGPARTFSLKTVCMIADQMLTRLETLHERGFLHRDLKPENVLVGPPNQSHVLHLIDFGLSCAYSPTLLVDGPKRAEKCIGTLRYMSRGSHRGRVQTPKDDLESLGFLLIYFAIGHVPWQKKYLKVPPGATTAEHKKLVLRAKEVATPPILCKGLPHAFEAYMTCIRDLRPVDVPNYKGLRSLFVGAAKDLGDRYDWHFDWDSDPEYLAQRQMASCQYPLTQIQYQQSQQLYAQQQQQQQAMQAHALQHNQQHFAPPTHMLQHERMNSYFNQQMSAQANPGLPLTLQPLQYDQHGFHSNSVHANGWMPAPVPINNSPPLMFQSDPPTTPQRVQDYMPAGTISQTLPGNWDYLMPASNPLVAPPNFNRSHMVTSQANTRGGCDVQYMHSAPMNETLNVAPTIFEPPRSNHAPYSQARLHPNLHTPFSEVIQSQHYMKASQTAQMNGQVVTPITSNASATNPATSEEEVPLIPRHAPHPHMSSFFTNRPQLIGATSEVKRPVLHPPAYSFLRSPMNEPISDPH